MTSYDDWYPSNYFKADDVDRRAADPHHHRHSPGEDARRKIKARVCSSRRTSAALVLNVTNKNFLILLTRSKNPADAIGQRVILVAVEGEYQGKPCMALRLRRPPAAGEAPPCQQPKPAAKVAKRKPPLDDDTEQRRHPALSAMSITPARPLPPAVRDKLGKLLPMLSSRPRRRTGRRGGGDRAGAEKPRPRLARSDGEYRRNRGRA